MLEKMRLSALLSSALRTRTRTTRSNRAILSSSIFCCFVVIFLLAIIIATNDNVSALSSSSQSIQQRIKKTTTTASASTTKIVSNSALASSSSTATVGGDENDEATAKAVTIANKLIRTDVAAAAAATTTYLLLSDMQRRDDAAAVVDEAGVIKKERRKKINNNDDDEAFNNNSGGVDGGNILVNNRYVNGMKQKLLSKELFAPIPPPEDQFIMTGDVAVLFVYAFTSHSINDAIVNQMLDNRHDKSLVDTIREIDPAGHIVNTNAISVWVDKNTDVAVQHALEVTARESLMNHWGPLLSSEGTSCVALCTCWLLAGYLHRAFLYKNSIHCDSTQALKKTIETWITSALLLTTIAICTDFVIGQYVPLYIQNLLCVQCHNTPEASLFVEGPGLGYGSIIKDVVAATSASNEHGSGIYVVGNGNGGSLITSAAAVLSTLTQSDTMFIVDSLTVLIAWRWTANRISQFFF